MKRVKIMLSAIMVLAVVGGALAFKATKFDNNYCLLTTDGTPAGGGSCTSYIPNRQEGGSGARWFTIAAPVGVDTDDECKTLQCAQSTFIVNE